MLIYDIFDNPGFDSLWHISIAAPGNWFTWLERKRRQTDLDLTGSNSEAEKFMCLPPGVRVHGGKMLSVNQRLLVPPSVMPKEQCYRFYVIIWRDNLSTFYRKIWQAPKDIKTNKQTHWKPTRVNPRDETPVLCKLVVVSELLRVAVEVRAAWHAGIQVTSTANWFLISVLTSPSCRMVMTDTSYYYYYYTL